MTFDEAVRIYLQHLRAKRRAPKTMLWYSEQFAAYRRWCERGGHGDELPDADMIDAFLADQHDSGAKPSTVHARYRALRAVFRFLEKRRKLRHDDNPIHLLEAPNVPSEVRRHVTIEDLDHLLMSIEGQDWIDHRDRLILLILFYSGLRLGELCGLAVNDIDAQALEITVHHGKGDKARVVPAAPEMRTALTAYLFTRPNHTSVLLVKSDGYGGGAGALQPEGVRQMLIRRCIKAGIEPYSPHAFRHGFAMWLLNAGARLTTVSTAMGHSDPSITHEIYAHTTVTTVRREYDEARKVIRRPPNG